MARAEEGELLGEGGMDRLYRVQLWEQREEGRREGGKEGRMEKGRAGRRERRAGTYDKKIDGRLIYIHRDEEGERGSGRASDVCVCL